MAHLIHGDPHTDDRLLRVLCCNVEVDNGGDFEKIKKCCEYQRQHNPDIVLFQEAYFSQENDQFLLKLRAHWLGNKLGFIGPMRDGKERLPYSAMFLDPALIVPGSVKVEDQSDWGLPPSHVQVRFVGTQRPVTLLSFHLNFNSVMGRELQADWMTRGIDRRDQEVIAAGDTNCYPEEEGEVVPHPDWEAIRRQEFWDRPHWVHRTREMPPGSGIYVSDTEPDKKLRRAGYVDPARELGAQAGRAHALAPTTSGEHRSGQGGPTRIDRFYLTPRIASTAVDLRVIPADGHSDHDWPMLFCDREKFITELMRA